MSFNDLSVAERQHVQRAFSQALYYAQRGFFDACRLYAPSLPAAERSKLTGVVGEFIHAYIASELGHLIAQTSDGNTLIEPPPRILDPQQR